MSNSRFRAPRRTGFSLHPDATYALAAFVRDFFQWNPGGSREKIKVGIEPFLRYYGFDNRLLFFIFGLCQFISGNAVPCQP